MILITYSGLNHETKLHSIVVTSLRSLLTIIVTLIVIVVT